MFGELNLGEADSVSHVPDRAGQLEVAVEGAAMDLGAPSACYVFWDGFHGSRILSMLK